MAKILYSQEHKKLIQRLIRARKQAGLSQVEAAKLLETTQPNISFIESGQRKVDAIELKRTARVYKKPITFFLK